MIDESQAFYMVLTQVQPHTAIKEICYTQKLAEKIYEKTKKECIEDEASTHLMLVKAFVADFHPNKYTFFTELVRLMDSRDTLGMTSTINSMLKWNDAIIIKEEYL